MDREEAAERIQEVMTIIKAQHMCKDIDGECTQEDRNTYIQRFEALRMAVEVMQEQTEYQKRIKSLMNIIEDICKESRERHVDDEHCGLCEYGGSYIKESGDWENECPGFDADDCFELSKKFRSKYIDWSEKE